MKGEKECSLLAKKLLLTFSEMYFYSDYKPNELVMNTVIYNRSYLMRSSYVQIKLAIFQT